jgi:hypothetical protein
VIAGRGLTPDLLNDQATTNNIDWIDVYNCRSSGLMVTGPEEGVPQPAFLNS